MAITLNSLTNNALLAQNANQAIAKQASNSADPLNAANQRVPQQINSTGVSLSPYSQLLSGFSGVQAAAKVLSDPTKINNAADLAKAVQSFANAYNTTTSAANSAAAIGRNLNASQSANDLNNIVSSGSNTSDLKKIGVNVNSDGTLSVNAAALQSALQTNPDAVKSTLSNIGKQADQIASNELSASSNVSSSANAFNNRYYNLVSQLSTQQNLSVTSADTVQQQVANFSGNSSAVSSYLQMLAM